ncbi:MAG TPA: GNAT family N-acetyltransferase [Acidimicrobiales bacterium]|jgi:ribosomal-protein-alanine N-acetyltransferase
MTQLERVRADHAPAILAFELANRAYFTGFISDRGDAYFEHFAQEHEDLLAKQQDGSCVFHVLVTDDGTVIGRFNLFDLEDGSAVLGYRVAQHAGGQGVATAGVQELCRIAVSEYGLHTLTAATNLENVASQRVLIKSGFVAVGPAEPGGNPGTLYQRCLTTE